ncbi:MFS transporter [Streptomyces lydicus]|uniref:MFS transporter n=1 Tax=Streptomyces lydicus TaxID=47763 RepID=UPI003D67BBA5
MCPLYAAGFTTAFGAHGIAANLGGFSEDAVTSLLVLGGLLALYDGAEVVLKPVFGTLADRIGAKPVLLGGLVALASALYAAAGTPGWLWAARLGQGAAVSAFSPAASALVARLNPAAKHGRAFGSYGFYKSLGYTLGPLLGGGLVWAGGLRLLFTVLAALAAAVTVWAALVVPRVPPLSKSRQTLLALARRLSDRVRPSSAQTYRATGRPSPSRSSSRRHRTPSRDSSFRRSAEADPLSSPDWSKKATSSPSLPGATSSAENAVPIRSAGRYTWAWRSSSTCIVTAAGEATSTWATSQATFGRREGAAV